ncbi:MAG: membrane protein insertion efficiency factor YidD [Pseudomonadales bacterium]
MASGLSSDREQTIPSLLVQRGHDRDLGTFSPVMPMKQALIALIRRYQRLGGSRSHFAIDCNFEPTCSEYACQALEAHGLRRGMALSLARIRRCNDRDAFNKRFDPVPGVPCQQHH